MKGVICYHSDTGNTRLACQRIATLAMNVDFTLYDIARDHGFDASQFEVVGFATPTHYWDPPLLMTRFIEALPRQDGKPAFVLSTYGTWTGKTLVTLSRSAQARGFRVIAAHALQTPENAPFLRMIGLTKDRAPNVRGLDAFHRFITQLDGMLAVPDATGLAEMELRAGMAANLMARPRGRLARYMGKKHIDAALCSGCGTCQETCPYGAITLSPKPEFDMNKCYGCWSCFNHCPKHAIFTRAVRGKGHYPRPTAAYRQKLTASQE